MTISAQQQAIDLIEENVTAWTNTLVTWLQEDVKQNEIKSARRNLLEATPESWEHTYYTTKLQEIENGTMIPYAIFSVETGRKYHKIIMKTACNADRTNDQTSVHAFVDKKTGEVYKAASWKAPAKHVRYDLRRIRDRQVLEVKCDWAGGYLYKV